MPHAWDRPFTELEPDGSVTYLFERALQPDAAILVVTRGGYIRTTFPIESLSRWLERPRAAGLVEVTDRAKGLGLAN